MWRVPTSSAPSVRRRLNTPGYRREGRRRRSLPPRRLLPRSPCARGTLHRREPPWRRLCLRSRRILLRRTSQQPSRRATAGSIGGRAGGGQRGRSACRKCAAPQVSHTTACVSSRHVSAPTRRAPTIRRFLGAPAKLPGMPPISGGGPTPQDKAGVLRFSYSLGEQGNIL
jgi:hypothetical protein